MQVYGWRFDGNFIISVACIGVILQKCWSCIDEYENKLLGTWCKNQYYEWVQIMKHLVLEESPMVTEMIRLIYIMLEWINLDYHLYLIYFWCCYNRDGWWVMPKTIQWHKHCMHWNSIILYTRMSISFPHFQGYVEKHIWSSSFFKPFTKTTSNGFIWYLHLLLNMGAAGIWKMLLYVNIWIGVSSYENNNFLWEALMHTENAIVMCFCWMFDSLLVSWKGWTTEASWRN